MVGEYLLWAIELAIAINNKDPGSWSQRLEKGDAFRIINKRNLTKTNIFAIGSKELNKLALVCTLLYYIEPLTSLQAYGTYELNKSAPKIPTVTDQQLIP
jgi:hypothetical protein